MGAAVCSQPVFEGPADVQLVVGPAELDQLGNLLPVALDVRVGGMVAL